MQKTRDFCTSTAGIVIVTPAAKPPVYLSSYIRDPEIHLIQGSKRNSRYTLVPPSRVYVTKISLFVESFLIRPPNVPLIDLERFEEKFENSFFSRVEFYKILYETMSKNSKRVNSYKIRHLVDRSSKRGGEVVETWFKNNAIFYLHE